MTTREVLQAAKAAAGALAVLGSEEKNRALLAMAEALTGAQEDILQANREDLEKAAANGMPDVMMDRLRLDADRIAGMARGIREVAELPDPVGAVISRIERPNGLVIDKVRVPMGVVAMIYESRPNVTSDAAALALKSGNVCVLRGGKEAFGSSSAIVQALRAGLRREGLPETFVNMVPDTSRAGANELMTAVGLVDLLIPRGGAGLIRACVEQARVPCIQTGTGICHIYVDAAADLGMALNILDNAKTSRPSVCNAAEVCLVHRQVAPVFLPMLAERLTTARAAAGKPPVELRLDPAAAAIIPARRILTPSSSITSWRCAWWRMYGRPLRTLRRIPPTTARPLSPAMPGRPGCLRRRWTARRFTSMRLPASPTAGNSAWGAKSVFPPKSSTPGVRWGWRS